MALIGGRLDEIESCEDGGSLSGDPFEMNLELTEAIRGMRQDDIQFTQESQAKAAAIIGSQPSATVEELTCVFRDIMNLVSDKPDLLRDFLEDLKKLREKYRQRVADESLAKGKGQGPAPLRMVETGKSKRKTEKRKRSGGLF